METENTKSATGTWSRPLRAGDRVFYTVFGFASFGTVEAQDRPSGANVGEIYVAWDSGVRRWEIARYLERA